MSDIEEVEPPEFNVPRRPTADTDLTGKFVGPGGTELHTQHARWAINEEGFITGKIEDWPQEPVAEAAAPVEDTSTVATSDEVTVS